MTDHHTIDLSCGLLSIEAMEYLEGCSEAIVLEAGAAVVRRGEPGRAFYVVRTGVLEIRLPGSGGRHMTLAHLGEGATFGEMAILLDQPVSADVVVVEKATLLACPASCFTTALAECEGLRNQLLMRLADDLNRTSADAWDFFQRAEALRLLVRGDSKVEPFLATSSRLRKLMARAHDLAATGKPILLVGAPGTGKQLLARNLHRGVCDEAAPLITVDCKRLEGDDARRLLLGPAGSSQACRTGPGLGALQLARGGSLILHHVGLLDPELQERLAAELSASREAGHGTPTTRVMATLRSEGKGADPAPQLHPELAAIFGDRRLLIPSLVDRRRDILPLARHFLALCSPDYERSFSREAEHALVSLPYRHHNVAELRDTVELAVRLTDEPEIGAEDLFSGPMAATRPMGFDLNRLHALRFLLQGKRLTAVRAVTLLSFLAVIVICLTAPQSKAAGVANGIIWTAWEPAVFALFLLLGSVWCTVCPLSTAGRLAQGFFSLDRPPSRWLKRWGLLFATAGFFAIVWSERVFHMISNPPASAVMLLALIVAPVVFCVIYRREVWCRHLCPLGALASGLAPSAVLQIGSNPSVCTSTCTEHSCYRGAHPIPGCTVFHHPLDSDEDHRCKLCLDCLKSCPHDSARLYLRPPLAGIWRLSGPDAGLAPFATAIFALALFLLVSRQPGWWSETAAFTLGGVAAVVVGALFSLILPRVLFREPHTERTAGTQVAFGLLVLGWGPLMAGQVANIQALGGIRLNADPGSPWLWFMPADGLSLTLVLQVAVIAFAAVFAVIGLFRMRTLARRRSAAMVPAGWATLGLICTAYVVAALTAL